MRSWEMKLLPGWEENKNITKLFHCATRLRFQLADMSKADLEGIKKLPDVMGVVESVGGVQVIIEMMQASAYAANCSKA